MHGPRKGQLLPMNIIIILIIAIIIVTAIAVYFSGIITVSMSDAEARRLFQDGCLRYCDPDIDQNYINSYRLVNDPSEVDLQFIMACEKLGYGTRVGYEGNAYEYPNRCLEFCGIGLCDMDVSGEDVRNTDAEVLSRL